MAYYDIHQLNSIAQLRGIFPDGKADHMNWCLLSTSGVHGSYTTFDDLKDEWGKIDGETQYITVLVIQPRLVCLHYGEIKIAATDVPWLENLVATSLAEIVLSQKENVKGE